MISSKILISIGYKDGIFNFIIIISILISKFKKLYILEVST